jgi:hypothetical protein
MQAASIRKPSKTATGKPKYIKKNMHVEYDLEKGQFIVCVCVCVCCVMCTILHGLLLLLFIGWFTSPLQGLPQDWDMLLRDSGIAPEVRDAMLL